MFSNKKVKKLETENEKLKEQIFKLQKEKKQMKGEIKKLEKENKEERRKRYDCLYDLKQLRDPSKKKKLTTGLSKGDIKAINKLINKINK